MMDGRVYLDPHRLKALRRARGISQETLTLECADRGLVLSIASVKRAEAGRKVLYRTARELARFFEVQPDSLMRPDEVSDRTANPDAARGEPSAARAFLDAAEELVSRRNYADALARVDTAMAGATNDASAARMVYLKGVLLRLLDLPEKSLGLLQRALEQTTEPHHRCNALLELALVFSALQRRKEALEALERAVAAAPPGDQAIQGRIERCRHGLALGEQRSPFDPGVGAWLPPQLVPAEEFLAALDAEDLASPPVSARRAPARGKTIEVGVLHSRTGHMRELEAGVIQATLFSLEEINQRGGLLGKQVVPVLADGESHEDVFYRQAERLIQKEKVGAIFGCSTSSSRRRVKPLVERHDHLLLYPFQYEGIEASAHIAYLGPSPNQQALPAVEWMLNRNRTRCFLVGSDYVYPLVTNELIKQKLSSWGCEIAGEAYAPLGATDFDAIARQIAESDADALLLTVVGLQSNGALLRALRRAGLSAPKLMVLSLVLSENDLIALPVAHTAGIYTLFSYFQNIDDAVNRDFVRRFKARFGPDSRVGGYMESAYLGAQLWARAVLKAGSFDAPKVRVALRGVSHYGPGGMVYLDETNNHVWRHVRVAQVGEDGEFHVVWNSPRPVPPQPYPFCRSPQDWESFLQSLRARWGGAWEAVAPGALAAPYRP